MKKSQINFFTPSPSEGEGRMGVMRLEIFMQRLGKVKEFLILAKQIGGEIMKLGQKIGLTGSS